MSKLLDLRKRGIEKVKVVERVIFQPRSFKYEMARMLIVVLTVAAIGFGISNADDIPVLKNLVQENKPEEVKKTFNIRGIISEINESSITIINAKNQEDEVGLTYFVELNKLPIKIKNEIRENTLIRNKFGNEFSQNDLEVGQTVIVKGLLDGDIIFAHTLVIFPEIEKVQIEISTSTLDIIETATSTENSSTTIDTASTTEISTTTEETEKVIDENSTSTENPTTTDEINSGGGVVDTVVETVTETVGEVIDTITETVDGVVETITDTIENITGGNNETETQEVVDPSSEPVEESAPESVPELVS